MTDALLTGVPLAALSEFAEDVRRGLSHTPKRLQPKYLYDDLGSSLFAAICQLPWYRVARAEKRLLAEHAADLARIARPPLRVVELGCGTGEKLRLLLEAGARPPQKGEAQRRGTVEVHLVDVSPLALDEASAAVRHLGVDVVCHREAYEQGVRAATTGRRADEHILVLFLGSNIGNFDPIDAAGFLSSIRCALAPGDHLLLGVDLVKPEHELILAYDDPLGLTSAFNKNLLVRINRELGANFSLGAFDHRAAWNDAASRVEMHLVSRERQAVAIDAAACEIVFRAGESIWTESSYKYTPEQVMTMARRAGFACEQIWIETADRFASTFLRAV